MRHADHGPDAELHQRTARAMAELVAELQQRFDGLAPGEAVSAEEFAPIREAVERLARFQATLAAGVTEFIETVDDLRLSDAILQRADVLVLVADETGNIVFANAAVQRVLGYTSDAVLGAGWWRVSGLDDSAAQAERERMGEVARGERPIDTAPYERVARHRDGTERRFLWKDSQGPGRTVIGIGNDVTELRRLEGALHDARSGGA
jgi:PAS domain S-box-containing protein